MARYQAQVGGMFGSGINQKPQTGVSIDVAPLAGVIAQALAAKRDGLIHKAMLQREFDRQDAADKVAAEERDYQHQQADATRQLLTIRQAMAAKQAEDRTAHQGRVLTETERHNKAMEQAALARARASAERSGASGQSAIKAELSTVNSQIDDTRSQLLNAQRSKPKSKLFYATPADSVATVTGQQDAAENMRRFATKLDSLTGVRDSLAAVQQGRPAQATAADPAAEQRAAWDAAAAHLRAQKKDPSAVIGPRP